MKAHFAYLKYLLKHKYFVFLECCKLGIPWLGLIHDWHKFLPSEWMPYVHHFYNPDGSKKVITKTGYFKGDDMQDDAFNLATHLHYKRAKHHWQSWVSINSQDGGVDPLPIPHKYLKEMLADWKGASHAQGHGGDIDEWWKQNRYKMKFAPETRMWLIGHIDTPGWDWLKKVPMWEFHALAINRYPEWELFDDGPYYVLKESVIGRETTSRTVAQQWDNFSKGLFYSRDYTKTGLPWDSDDEPYWSGYWFQYQKDAEDFRELYGGVGNWEEIYPGYLEACEKARYENHLP